MGKIFNPDYVTIVRRKGNGYEREDITTAPVLPDVKMTAEEYRNKVIERLRDDPSVFLVLEDYGEMCTEVVRHPDGFMFHVSVSDNGEPFAKLRIVYEIDTVYEEEFVHDEKDPTSDVLSDLLNTVIYVLECIQNKDYSFVQCDFPYFNSDEPEDPIGLFDAGHILEMQGYQVERISTSRYLSSPYLFVHENEIVELGSVHFDGETLFVEMKRFFEGADPEVVERAVRIIKKEFRAISAIHWDDGSWSFRVELDEEVTKKNFIAQLLAAIAEIRTMIRKIEAEDGVGKEPWPMMARQRHFFIYETIDASIKLCRINI